MKRALVAFLVGCVAMGFASVALAGNNSQAGIAVHIGPTVPIKNTCISPVAGNGDVNHTELACGVGDTLNVYLLVCNGSHRNAETIAAIGGAGFTLDGSGVAGVDLGLLYDGAPSSGIDVLAWTKCSQLQFVPGSWPGSGSGGTFTWDSVNNCQAVGTPPTIPNQVISVIGVLEVVVFSPDIVQVVANPSSGEAAVIDCNSVNDRVDNLGGHLGSGGLCGPPGYSPCGTATPVEETTWGSIKKQFD